MSIADRLEELGIELPTGPRPIALYVPAVRSGNLLFISGQLPMQSGQLMSTGKLGADVNVEGGQAAARQATLNGLAIARDAVGGLDNVTQVVRLVGHVASAEGFTQQAAVVNGASELLVEIFGDKGKHARLALGAAELPLNAPVEIELILEVQ